MARCFFVCSADKSDGFLASSPAQPSASYPAFPRLFSSFFGSWPFTYYCATAVRFPCTSFAFSCFVPFSSRITSGIRPPNPSAVYAWQSIWKYTVEFGRFYIFFGQNPVVTVIHWEQSRNFRNIYKSIAFSVIVCYNMC